MSCWKKIKMRPLTQEHFDKEISARQPPRPSKRIVRPFIFSKCTLVIRTGLIMGASYWHTIFDLWRTTLPPLFLYHGAPAIGINESWAINKQSIKRTLCQRQFFSSQRQIHKNVRARLFISTMGGGCKQWALKSTLFTAPGATLTFCTHIYQYNQVPFRPFHSSKENILIL